nr:sodium/hydrogen exchanger 9B2-like [Pocillopora verrucosa]
MQFDTKKHAFEAKPLNEADIVVLETGTLFPFSRCLASFLFCVAQDVSKQSTRVILLDEVGNFGSHLYYGHSTCPKFTKIIRFVQAAVSLAVVIPCLLELQEQHYGVKKGIPTLVMAAASFDNVLCISAFGICLGIAFGNLIFSIFRGPIELALEIILGCLAGLICWYFPNEDKTNLAQNRVVILLSLSLLSVFGSNVAKFSGAGALGVLTMSTVAAYGWTQQGKVPVALVMSLVWQVFEPPLFGLVGAEVSVEYMYSKVVGTGIASLVVSLVIWLCATSLGLLGNDLSLKERLFIAIAWSPKATVQAAIGSVSLDLARQKGFSGQIEEEFGIQILTIAVLVILITSPIGAIGIVLERPRMLEHSLPQEVEVDGVLHTKSSGSQERRESRCIECTV